MWFFQQVISPLVMIGLLVFVHELGHFIVAKLCGVGVLRFSVGFGPAIWTYRRKETQYQLSIIPLGGYVRMVGDMPDLITGAQETDILVRGGEACADQKSAATGARKPKKPADAEHERYVQDVVNDRSKWFLEKNFWQRSAIVIAGPLFNMVFAAFAVFVAIAFFGVHQPLDIPKIGAVQENSPAQAAGLSDGDLVRAIDGKAISTWEEMAETVYASKGRELSFTVEREGKNVELSVIARERKVQEFTGEKKSVFMIGVEPTLVRRFGGPVFAMKHAALWTVDRTIITYLGVWGLISGRASLKDLASPVFIVKKAGEEAKEGLDKLIYFTAFLSITLAVLNLLPIPVLDGGHLLFFIVEALIGPVSVRKKEYAQGVGMLLLLCLMVVAFHNDMTRSEGDLEKAAGLTWEAEEKKGGEAKESSDRSKNSSPASDTDSSHFLDLGVGSTSNR